MLAVELKLGERKQHSEVNLETLRQFDSLIGKVLLCIFTSTNKALLSLLTPKTNNNNSGFQKSGFESGSSQI